MADINSAAVGTPGAPAAQRRVKSEAPAPDPKLVMLVELLFFAYRDFTGEADEELAALGFGRAHHRVLHFVNRRPGLRVADLLNILKITKQSLARVLKELVDRGFIVQEAGAEDRREFGESGRRFCGSVFQRTGSREETRQKAGARFDSFKAEKALEFAPIRVDPESHAP